MTEATQGSMVNRVRKLMERAQHVNTTEHEREACLAKANEIMEANRIDRALLNAAKDTKRTGIDKREWPFPSFSDAFAIQIRSIIDSVIGHCHIRSAYKFDTVTVVGFSEDLFYAEMLYATINMEFARRINPEWDDALTVSQNIKALKEAGLKWQKIGQMAEEAGHQGNRKSYGWLGNAYRRECDRVGEEWSRQTQTHDAYRKSFASSFAATIKDRLRVMQERAEKQHESNGSGTELALRADNDAIDEEFWRLFPEFHPDAMKRKREQTDEFMRKMDDKEKQRRAGLSDKQRQAEDDRHARQAEQARKAYHKQRSSFDSKGWAAGDRVAAQVDLTMGKNSFNSERKQVEE